VNLFEVDKKIWSHPNKPYIYHIENIANAFDDKAHRVSANFHDIGKLSNEFQRYIRKETKEKTTHAIEGGYLFSFLTESIDIDFLSIFFSIVKHHGSLLDIRDDIYRYSNANEYDFEKDSWLEKLAIIESNLNVDSKHNAESFHKLMRMFLENFENFSTLEQFFLFKKRYSRLILADKFEAIFNESYQNIDYLPIKQIDTYIQNIDNIISSKPKNDFRNSAKKAIFDNYQKNKNSNIYLIKAPTGVGKTFIALELALTIAKDRGDKRRIITAIPFTSIIDQTHKEYENILGDVLKYHHLTKYKEQENEDEKEQFSQKVFLTDIWHENFIVTTFNQLLYTLFSNHNRDNVRLETLRDSVIIVDEVQNIPRVIISNIVKIFELFAKEYNIHFIIMSATMPSFEGLFENSVILSEDWFYHKKENRYRLHFIADMNTFEVLSDEINSQDKSVLCVVNTIDKAKTLFEEIEGEEREDKFLLTTHQIPLHRQEIIGEITDALSKGKKIKLISTQLIEAGVDLDFDIGYREFAPFGSIIQMAGRVNREGKKGICDVFVFDFLELKNQNEDIKRLPYRAIDLQEDNTIKWLSKPIEEIKILKNLDNYFTTIKEETTTINFLEPMKDLKFASLFKLLNENFMPNQPWKVSLFIELRDNQFNKYIEERNIILNNSNYDIFEAMNRVKDLEKDLGLYTITVNHKLIDKLVQNYPIDEKFGRYILKYNNPTYSKYKGFNPEYTSLEEMFDDF
jgi:CRISPR-associated endonuclease/helicase Cas3